MTFVKKNIDEPRSVSVVMSTYCGEKAVNLEQAINSIISQTHSPEEFLIVGDGPLPDEQLNVIFECAKRASFPLIFLPLEDNLGRGRARNYGIERCRSDYVALMDSDDIALPERLAAQIEFFDCNPEIDVLGTLTEEFEDQDELSTVVVKPCPPDHERIVHSLKFSNCVANPTLMFRRIRWMQVGGFPDFREINEDYLFYLRLIKNGARFACIQSVMLRVRVGRDQRLRRVGIRIFLADLKFRYIAYKEGHFSFFWFAVPLLLLFVRRLMPDYLAKISQRFWRRMAVRFQSRNGYA